MTELLNFLNQNAGALTVIFTAVVTISTVVYAYLTGKLVFETRRMRKVQTDPKVQVTLKPKEDYINIVYLYVKNIGLGPAYDVSFHVSCLAGGLAAEELISEFTRANFFATGLKYIGPGQEHHSSYAQMTKNYEGKIRSVFEIGVKYRNALNESFTEQFHFDMAEWKGLVRIGTPPLFALAKSLEQIQKDFGNLVSGFNRLKTDIYTSRDRELEEKATEEWHQEMQEKDKEAS